MNSGIKKQFVRILKDGESNGSDYKKGQVYEIIERQGESIVRISNKSLISVDDNTIYGKEAELINNFQNKYELWD